VAADTANAVIHVQEETKPKLEMGANFITDEGPAIMGRLRYDNILGRSGSNLLSYNYSDRQSDFAAIFDHPINGPGWLALRANYRWLRERPGLYDLGSEMDRHVFRRTQLSLDLAIHTFKYGWSLYLGGDWGQTNNYLESRQYTGSGNQYLRTMHFSLESHGRDLAVSRPERGMRLSHTRTINESSDETQWWRTDLGLVLPVLGMESWQPILAGGAVISSDNIPLIHQGRAGGPQGWIGLRRQEIIAPQIAWSRIALQRLFNDGFYVELAGSVGWHGQGTMSDAKPIFGCGFELGLKSFIGPMRLGYAVADLRPGYVYLQVGHEF